MAGKRTVVIKLGGSTLGSHDTTLADLVSLQRSGVNVVVVHGGGRSVSEWLERLNVPTKFVRGLRITDANTMKVVTAVLAGMVNKELVATIQRLGGKTVGLSCADGGIVRAEIKDSELGYVGEIVSVDSESLEVLLDAGFMPVVAPVSLLQVSKDDEVLLVNVNGDTVAGALAAAMGAERLVFLTDVSGIYDGEGRVISRLTAADALDLMSSGAIDEGMVPKLDSCLKALSVTDDVRVVDGRVAHALLHEMEGGVGGTTVAR